MLVPFFAEPSVQQRLAGLVPRLQAHGLHMVLYNVTSPAEARAQIVDLPRMPGLEALVVVSLPLDDEQANVLRRAPFPTVLLDTGAPGLPSLSIDDCEGGFIATRHLVDLGHRRIAFVGEPAENAFGFVASRRREEGYGRALAAAHLPLDPDLVRHGAHLRSAAKQMTLDLLDLADPPTAVVAASDTQAIGVLEAAEAKGLRVPVDLSVVGYDDIDVASLMGLTTVRQPLASAGARAADLVVEAIAASARNELNEVMGLELVVRSTTRPPR